MDLGLRSRGKTISVHGLSILADLRRIGQLCDGVIKVGYREFPIHRAIMSACSPYFRALFTSDFYSSSRREVTIPGVSPDIMAMIVDYAYTRETHVTTENVEELLPAADQFQINGMVKACCDFLVAELCPENCIGIRKFSKVYFCHGLERTAFHFIMQNFVNVLQTSDEFLELNHNEVCDILSSDELNVKDEETVFDAAVRWIDYNPEERRDHMPQLMQNVRLGLLPKEYFMGTVKPHPYVKENRECRPIVIDTLKFMYDLDMDEDKDVDLTNPLAKPRVPHEVLIVVGGWCSGAATNSFETYDTRADRWIVCEHVDVEARAYHGLASLDSILYMLGGFDGTEYFNSVRQFDLVSKRWSEAAPMNSKRCYLSVTVVGDYIYAIGGYDGDNRLSSAERYLPSKNQWSLIHPMNEKRSDAGATTLNGFDGQDCLTSAEYYQPETNQWTSIIEMLNRRSGVGVIAYHGFVYVLGGFNGISRLQTAERYCPESSRWQSVPDMSSARSNFAIEVIDDLIFTIGGYDGFTAILHVECFDGTNEEWYDASEMNQCKSGLSGCVVHGLPNVRDYIYKDGKATDTTSAV